MDYLHCSPDFHHQERVDCVLVDTVGGDIFAQLLLVFTCFVNKTPYPLALIQPLDAPIHVQRRKDKDLGFIRVRAKPRQSSEFISVRSIIRGALLVEEFDRKGSGEFIVVDVVDGDMFLRLREKYQWSVRSHSMAENHLTYILKICIPCSCH